MNESCQYCNGGSCLGLCFKYGTEELDMYARACPFCNDTVKINDEGEVEHPESGCILSEETFELEKWNKRFIN